jgi:hypothetical protein
MDVEKEINTDLRADINKLKLKLSGYNKGITRGDYKKTSNKYLNYENISSEFVKEYSSSNFIQYSHLYFVRLTQIKNDLHKIAERKWPHLKICKNILDVKGKVKFIFTA